ncbi:MAG: GNAT family N-acetyltransferase, partial [Candidatus Omnitrophota bacterium]
MRIEACQKSEQPEVIEMLRENFQREKMRKAKHFGAEYWKWQYANNPFGRAITLLAKENGALAGQYANIPIDLKLDGKVVKAATVIDLMVRPEFRRQGIFKKMGEEANRILSRENFALSLAFPSRKDSSAGFVQRLGWQVVGELRVMVGITVPKSGTLGRRGTGAPVIKIKTADSFPERVNELWEETRPQIKVGVERNQKYLNWRYGQNPATKYEIFLGFQDNDLAGYLVLKTERIMGIKLGIIVDMLCRNDEAVIRGLMHKGMQYLHGKGAQACVSLKNSLYACALKALGFWELPSWLNPKRYTLIVRPNQEGPNLSLIKDLNNWYLHFGDWDLV